MKVEAVELNIKARVFPGNEKATQAAVGGLLDMFKGFDKKNSDTEINEHITRINGYVYALVNVGILEEEQANGSMRSAVCMLAAGRMAQLEAIKRK